MLESIRKVIDMLSVSPPKAHKFISVELNSTTIELTEVLMNIDKILSQITDFTTQLDSLIISYNINLVSDSAGNLSIDAPVSMPDEQAQYLGKRVGVLDSLLGTTHERGDKLFAEAYNIESSLKEKDPKYNSVILDKLSEFNKLKNKYKH